MRKITATLVLLACAFAVAQNTNDVDKQKLIDIEQKFAAIPVFNSPEMSDFLQKHIYDGTYSVVVTFGHLYHVARSEVVAFTQKPDPDDPNVKSVNKLSDLQVDIYDDTALVSYKQVSTDSGHKLSVLDGDYSLTCLDTFVKRKGEWYILGGACVPAAPISQAKWDANKEKEDMAKQKAMPPSSPQ